MKNALLIIFTNVKQYLVAMITIDLLNHSHPFKMFVKLKDLFEKIFLMFFSFFW